MISEENIKKLAAELDDMLALLAVKYDMSALSLTAIVNARLMHATREAGSEEDFRSLLRTIAGREYEPHYTSYSRH